MAQLSPRGPYSPIKHLALSVWLNHDPRERFMAMFTACFDASGDDCLPFMFVSGFVASVEKWLRFDREWKRHLDRYGVEGFFRMSKFVARQYPTLLEEERRRRFLIEAIKIIRKNTNKSFSCGVEVPTVLGVAKDYRFPMDHVEGAYTWCAMPATRSVVSWAKKRIASDKKPKLKRLQDIEFVYEQGDQHQGEFAQEFRRNLGMEPVFKSKEEWIPFQACDFLAWEHRTSVIDQKQKGKAFPHEFRASVRALYKTLPSSWMFLDGDRIRKMLEARDAHQGPPVSG